MWFQALIRTDIIRGDTVQWNRALKRQCTFLLMHWDALRWIWPSRVRPQALVGVEYNGQAIRETALTPSAHSKKKVISAGLFPSDWDYHQNINLVPSIEMVQKSWTDHHNQIMIRPQSRSIGFNGTGIINRPSSDLSWYWNRDQIINILHRFFYDNCRRTLAAESADRNKNYNSFWTLDWWVQQYFEAWHVKTGARVIIQSEYIMLGCQIDWHEWNCFQLKESLPDRRGVFLVFEPLVFLTKMPKRVALLW